MPVIQDDTFLDRVFRTLLGRIFVVLLQTSLVSLALLGLFALQLYINPRILKYTVVLVVGLAAGFSARRFLKDRSLVLRIAAALLAAALSLTAQGSISAGFIGIQPFPGSASYPDWKSLIQLGVSITGAMLVVLSFRTPRIPVPEGSTRIQQASIPAGGVPQDSRAAASSPSSQPARAAANNTARATKLTLDPPRGIVKSPASKRNKANSLDIHFIGEEEHTCPYCLDRVEKNDPRGIKICPVCKTWHHADCWGITGACQIPHMHES